MRFLALILAFFTVACASSSYAASAPGRVVVLGDSLTAGYGLQQGQDFVSQMQAALSATGVNVKLENAGVSGDTSAGGRSRLDWAIGGDPKPRLVMVALGGNDLLRGLDPQVTHDNLSAILKTLRDRKIPAMLIGMKAPANLGPIYQRKFDKVYVELADEYSVPLYPFFLEGVALNSAYNQDDGVHPNRDGIAVIVAKMMPAVKKVLDAQED